MHQPSDRPAVSARDLAKTYPGARNAPPVHALAGLSLEVPAGSVFALLGPNRAGKSSTVKVLTTLASADSGTAVVAGHDVRRAPDRVRRAGLVAQRSSADPMATGRENLRLAARVQGLSRAAATTRSGALLARFGLEDAANRLAKTYSGGMARKLDVAIALVHQPSVLFLDEPTTGLDPEARAQLWSEIARLRSAEQVTVLLTTHYLDEADRLADRLAIVDSGRIVVEGTPDALKNEMRGDSVHVELESFSPSAVTALSTVRGVREVSAEGTRLRARTDRGAGAVPAVLAALDGAGVGVASITVARPTLDEVYLRHVGREFRGVA